MKSQRFFFVVLGLITRCVESHPSPFLCKEVQIPVYVSVPRFIVNTTIEDDWDVVALASNLTQRDSGNVTDPLPIAGTTSGPVASSFEIGAELCGLGSTVLVLTHGIIESKQ
jgi:hypothetical protein